MGEGATLASALAGSMASIISVDVALDASEPVVGSFTADGMTYAVNDGKAALASVAGPLAGPEGEGSAEGGFANISVPATVIYDDTTYDVVAIGAFAFYLSGATDVALPASIASVDERAFRSSEVERVEVAADNPNLASYDGALYAADLSRLLLIPGGRGGAVRIPDNAEEVPAEAFSHCAQVDAVSVDGGSPAFSSWEGLLYSADGATLLRVPAGATEIAIRDGCTAIAAGAMEGCAKLERIDAPASVASISPDVFTSIPTVSLPAQMAMQDGATSGVASALQDGSQDDSAAGPLAGPGYEGDARSASADPPAEGEAGGSAGAEGEASGAAGTQLTAMVALSTVDDDLPEVDPSSIAAILPKGCEKSPWASLGFLLSEMPAEAMLQEAASQRAFDLQLSCNGGRMASTQYPGQTFTTGQTYNSGDSIAFYANGSVVYFTYTITYSNPGCTFNCYSLANSYAGSSTRWTSGTRTMTTSAYCIWNVPITWSANGGYWNGNPSDTANKSNTWTSNTAAKGYGGSTVPQRVGYRFTGWRNSSSGAVSSAGTNVPVLTATTYAAQWTGIGYTIAFDANGVSGAMPESIAATYGQDVTLPFPEERAGYRFLGWNTAADGSGTGYQAGAVRNLTDQDGAMVTLYAQWKRVDFELGFDVDSEPDDVEYPGDAKNDQEVSIDDGQVEIEEPKRPGYVFEGWVIPTEDGTEAVDQDLVYQGSDGKWYVDASKLPDYAGDDGRVELTARWTSVISVDVPSSVTFYADLVTQGQESREGAADGAFGQSKVANQSQVDLRVVGLESSAVKTMDTTLGADSILKKADAATPSSSTQKLLSLYPSTKQWTADELQDPDVVGGSKAATAVDFDLDDTLLEKSFKADDFTIAAGGTLNMGYRLNLSETGQQLDYDKLSTLSEGQSASIANVSYCFAADALPSDWGEPLWVENPDRSSNPAKYLLLKDIKQAADDLSANGTNSEYYSLYKGLLDNQVTNNGNPGAGPYFQLKVDGRYLPLQLIGICQDTKSDGTGKAGLTFHVRDVYAFDTTGSNGTFDCRMFHSNVGADAGGWANSAMRANLRTGFLGKLDAKVANSIVPVVKRQQLGYGATSGALQVTKDETIWLPSVFEVYGVAVAGYGPAEGFDVAAAYVPFQYEAYRGNNGSYTNSKALKMGTPPMDGVRGYWLRSCNCGSGFSVVNGTALCTGDVSTRAYGVAPAFCL